MQPLELWGGIECTVNRVHSTYFNQLARSGHAARVDDLDRLAALGLRTLRYPVLWELQQPDPATPIDWSWADERLHRLRDLSITPIVGLVHHGSGPRHTDLLVPGFATGLAEYAGAVASRYPWLESYTPVNEPLTTARFSGLYGHWFPHGKDDATFVRILINECRATVLAMQAIRRINPRAQLVQTDDLGETYSTPRLAYQARFDNERRWLAWDLLCGRVTASHPLWSFLRGAGCTRRELEWFLRHPCPPDVIGINHYVTSDRFLDDRLAEYPRERWGGNGRDRYVDVEAVRVLQAPRRLDDLLADAWQRYHVPLAITEVHLGCTRDEQLRWFEQTWDAAARARNRGCDLRAVTAWALFGSYDWDSLLTRAGNHYEPGAFDVRGPAPRPTALAHAIARRTGSSRAAPLPVVSEAGWWERDLRFTCGKSYGNRHRRRMTAAPTPRPPAPTARAALRQPLLIVGARGTLGTAFRHGCERRGVTCHASTREQLDVVDDPRSIAATMAAVRPWAVVNAAGYVRVDEAERDVERCRRLNVHGAANLAAAAAAQGVPYLTFSSDLVFGDSARAVPYSERDAPSPLNVYGASKAQAEVEVLRGHPEALIIRTSAFFGPWDEHNFLTRALRTISRSETFTAPHDVIISPTYVPDLVDAALDLLMDREHGVWHLAHPCEISWFDLARLAVRLSGLACRLVTPCTLASMRLPARRPQYSALGSERGAALPSVEDAVSRYAAELKRRWPAFATAPPFATGRQATGASAAHA